MLIYSELYQLVDAFLGAPAYHLLLEGGLFLMVLWLMFRKSYKPELASELSEKEKEELIESWKPEPLVPKVPQDHYALNPRIVSSKLGKFITVNDKSCLNLGTHNYLGLAESDLAKEYSIKALRKYGVGSCGPRGFYGTVDIHLQLEERLANFMRVEEAVLYSYGFSSVASAIPAYAKKGDVIFCDEAVHLAIQKGLVASRSDVRFFKHNDVKDLERLLLEQAADDKKNPRKAKVTRRFLVVEGLYMNTGEICPLPELMALKHQHKVRIFVDEICSFGVLGENGRGVAEHFNIPTDDIDHFSASLENAIAAYGGFCCGSTFVADHQRLSGLGYCFSASLPPLQAAAAIAALDILEESNELVSTLRQNSMQMDNLLKNSSVIETQGADISPVKHLRYRIRGEREKETRRLELICDYAWTMGYALTVARYIEREEYKCPEPSIRLTINARLTPDEVTSVARFLDEAFQKCSS